MKGGTVGLRHGREGLSVQAVAGSCGGNFLCREGTAGGGLCPVVGGIVGQHGHDSVQVLVVYHAEDDAPAAAGLVTDLPGEVLPASGIVPCVADDQRTVLQLLPSPHQACSLADIGEASGDAVGISDHTFIIQEHGGCQHRVGILLLIAAAQFAGDVAEEARPVSDAAGRECV